MSTNSTTTLSDADIRPKLRRSERKILARFNKPRYRFALHAGEPNMCRRLVVRGLMDSMIVNNSRMAYRTNAAGRAEVKRAGGSK